MKKTIFLTMLMILMLFYGCGSSQLEYYKEYYNLKKEIEIIRTENNSLKSEIDKLKTELDDITYGAEWLLYDANSLYK